MYVSYIQIQESFRLKILFVHGVSTNSKYPTLNLTGFLERNTRRHTNWNRAHMFFNSKIHNTFSIKYSDLKVTDCPLTVLAQLLWWPYSISYHDMWPRIGANLLFLVYDNGMCLWEKVSVVPFLWMQLEPYELLISLLSSVYTKLHDSKFLFLALFLSTTDSSSKRRTRITWNETVSMYDWVS